MVVSANSGGPSPARSRVQSDQAVRLGLWPVGAYAPEGTTEGTPENYFHSNITHNCVME
jgi:hypothetical protein